MKTFVAPCMIFIPFSSIAGAKIILNFYMETNLFKIVSLNFVGNDELSFFGGEWKIMPNEWLDPT
jgi:hypothetical protein